MSLLSLLLFIPSLVNVSFSVFAAVCFRKYPRPPFWIIVFLIIFGTGSVRLLFMGDFGPVIAWVTVLTAIICIIGGLALLCRFILGTGLLKSWVISRSLILPLAIYIDLRFSVLVVDDKGTSVEVNSKALELQAQPFMVFHSVQGHRLKKGVVYFGFCQWVRFRDGWYVFGEIGTPEGKLLRQKQVAQPASWGSWPLRVTID